MQPNGYSHQYGKYEITMDRLLPQGAWLVSAVEAIKDFDRSTPGPEGFVQARDKDSGEELWTVTVQSGDMEGAPVWLQRFKVKIASSVKPELPPMMPGTPFRPVWFDGLVVVPYVDDKSCAPPEPGKRHRCRAKVAYSVRASGLRAPKSSRPSQVPASGSAA